MRAKKQQGGRCVIKITFAGFSGKMENETRNRFPFLKERITNIALCFRFSKLFCHFGKRKTEWENGKRNSNPFFVFQKLEKRLALWYTHLFRPQKYYISFWKKKL